MYFHSFSYANKSETFYVTKHACHFVKNLSLSRFGRKLKILRAHMYPFMPMFRANKSSTSIEDLQ